MGRALYHPLSFPLNFLEIPIFFFDFRIYFLEIPNKLLECPRKLIEFHEIHWSSLEIPRQVQQQKGSSHVEKRCVPRGNVAERRVRT